MTAMKSFLKLITFCIVLLLGFGIVTHFPTMITAQSQPPTSSQGLPNTWGNYEPDPSIGKPGRREGGGTRGPCAFSRDPGKTLTALVPVIQRKAGNSDTKTVAFGATIEGSPTFFFYVPPTAAQRADFSLQDKNDQNIYQTTFSITGDPGIVSVTLPSFANSGFLESKKDYFWSFALSCNSKAEDSSDRSGVLAVNGWIQRVQANPDLAQKLGQATLRDKVALYTKAGIWYDALHSLAELRRSSPNDASLSGAWTNLLQSAGLDKLASEGLGQNALLP
ncbi:DUF928 domain-containing protein [Planktothrix sp. FACHB-1355]|uniref:DUF928 domain-containing protein n=1 Tax=Aerosakkonema funiforme FACHB-1375 TaxID=2949571 RepID=A0A926VBX2_9CYAN|nr:MULTISPECIES: DUF928 domain-containing protein [Oscillatoriales]MBD2180513.1 DUF928 domain-containing protein [Aerosakkonema funiforme FACHB-1375]MBD3562530.1 DUF928 domain-containing protein [Planktothrix sp. FACHB-1355]